MLAEVVNPWTAAWAAWALLFLAIEIPALIQKGDRTDTLSQHVRWFRNRSWVTHCALGAAWLWLTLHFFFDV